MIMAADLKENRSRSGATTNVITATNQLNRKLSYTETSVQGTTWDGRNSVQELKFHYSQNRNN